MAKEEQGRIRNQLFTMALRVSMENPNPREYHRGCEEAIIYEVVCCDHSYRWVVLNDQTAKIAKAVERKLAKFNIGYTDDARGKWSYVRGGTKFFQ